MQRLRIPLLATVLSLSLGALINTEQSAFAQTSEEDLSLDFVKKQLAKVRAGTPAADPVSPHALQEETEKLLAEESALLSQLSGETKPGVSHSPAEAARASADLNRAMGSLATDDAESIPVVRASVAAIPSKDDKPDSPEPTQELRQAPRAAPDIISAHATPDAVDSMLASLDRSTEDTSRAASLTDKNLVAAPRTSPQESPADVSVASLSRSNHEVATLRKSNGDLRRQVEQLQRKLREATGELQESRNRLMIAETEVERLSNVLEQRNRTTLARVAPEVAQAQHARREYHPPQPASVAKQVQPPTQTTTTQPARSDMLVGTVTADKAFLRSGAGKENSPLMSVSRGTRLVIETRQGSWYRVITPNGTRAWVSSEVISFGADNSASPGRTVSIRGSSR
jgi:hypothetical protein